jgi:hypothetical protein
MRSTPASATTIAAMTAATASHFRDISVVRAPRRS